MAADHDGDPIVPTEAPPTRTEEPLVPAEAPPTPPEEPLVLPGIVPPLPVTTDPRAPATGDDLLAPDVPAYPEPEPLPDPAPDWLTP